MPTTTRTCAFCAKPFETTYLRGRPPSFCSDECRTAAKSSRARVCVACKSFFTLADYKTGDTVRVQYCSDACASGKKCRGCNNPFDDQSSGKLPSTFCSVECQAKVDTGPKECEFCTKPIPFPKPPAPLRGRPRFCGEVCRTLWMQAQGSTVRTNADRHWNAYWENVNTDWYLHLLPLSPGGKPYFCTLPEDFADESWLTPRNRAALHLWRTALERLQAELDPLVVAAYYVTHGSQSLGWDVASYQPLGSPTLWELTPWLLKDLVRLWGGQWVNTLSRYLHAAPTTNFAIKKAEKRLVSVGTQLMEILGTGNRHTLRTPAQNQRLEHWLTETEEVLTDPWPQDHAMHTGDKKVTNPTRFVQLINEWKSARFIRNGLRPAPNSMWNPVLDQVPAAMYTYANLADHDYLSTFPMGAFHIDMVNQWAPIALQQERPTVAEIGLYQRQIMLEQDPAHAGFYVRRLGIAKFDKSSSFVHGYDFNDEDEDRSQWMPTTPKPAGGKLAPRPLPEDFQW